jgi:hypothetical protein
MKIELIPGEPLKVHYAGIQIGGLYLNILERTIYCVHDLTETHVKIIAVNNGARRGVSYEKFNRYYNHLNMKLDIII